MNNQTKHRNIFPVSSTGGILRCFLFAALVLFCVQAGVHASVFKARIIPENPKGGEALYIKATGPEEYKYEADFNGKSYDMFTATAGKHELLLPTGIEGKGARKIVLRALKNDKVAERKQFEVYVTKRKVKVIKLTESGEQMRDTQPSVQTQQESVLDAINIISKTRFWDAAFQLPLKTSGKSNFAVKREGKKYSYYHKGIDINAAEGAPVRAANTGRVALAAEKLNIYGNAVVIDHGEGLVSCYFHLSKLSVKKGDEVSAGQEIGSVGSTGWSSGPHLHFAVYVRGAPIDPLWWIKFSEKIIQ